MYNYASTSFYIILIYRKLVVKYRIVLITQNYLCKYNIFLTEIWNMHHVSKIYTSLRIKKRGLFLITTYVNLSILSCPFTLLGITRASSFIKYRLIKLFCVDISSQTSAVRYRNDFLVEIIPEHNRDSEKYLPWLSRRARER